MTTAPSKQTLEFDVDVRPARPLARRALAVGDGVVEVEMLHGSAVLELVAEDEARAADAPPGTIGSFSGRVIVYEKADLNFRWFYRNSVSAAVGRPLLRAHNSDGQPVGVINAFNRDGEMRFTGYWLDTQAGRDARTEALARTALGGVVEVSYGVMPIETEMPTAEEMESGIMIKLVRGELREISLVVSGAVPSAEMLKVAALEPQPDPVPTPTDTSAADETSVATDAGTEADETQPEPEPEPSLAETVAAGLVAVIEEYAETAYAEADADCRASVAEGLTEGVNRYAATLTPSAPTIELTDEQRAENAARHEAHQAMLSQSVEQQRQRFLTDLGLSESDLACSGGQTHAEETETAISRRAMMDEYRAVLSEHAN